MLSYVFSSMLLTSLIGTALTLLLVLLRPITRRFFSSRWQYYVWIVVLLAMLIPFRFAVEANPVQSDGAMLSGALLTEITHADFTPNDILPKTPLRFYEAVSFVMGSLSNWIAPLWIAGALLLLLWKLYTYSVFLIRLRHGSQIIPCPELKSFTAKKITTRVCTYVSSPLMIGLFRPTLVLPYVSLTEEQLGYVLAHEITHLRRGDILYKWVVAFVQCVHWFNPIVCYIGRQISLDCELSCDAAVVKDMSDEQKTKYIDTILSLLAYGSRLSNAVTTGMASDKKMLQRRFTMIKHTKSPGKLAAVVSVALVLAVISCTVYASGMLGSVLIEIPEEPYIDMTVETPNTLNSDSKDAYASVERLMVDDESVQPDNPSEEAVQQDTSTHTTLQTPKSDENATYDAVKSDVTLVSPVFGKVAATFGKRINPITSSVIEHSGVDIAAPKGTAVVSAISGTVTEAAFDSQYGNFIVVEGENIRTLYAHLSEIAVQKGEVIAAADPIGTVGATGMATGAHLHFEVMVDGVLCDPQELLG